MRPIILFTLLALIILPFGAWADGSLLKKGHNIMQEKPQGYPSAIVAGGCFWCLESEFRAQDGVLFTRSGYIGGTTKNPTYQDITTGQTGHAEAVEVTYDPAKISYTALLEFFLTKAHNPTQLNRQGVDKGTQYRSAIFPGSDEEKAIAEKLIADINARKVWSDPIVTAIEPLATFWPAEDYHQQYYEKYRDENGKDHIRVIMKKAGKL